MPIQIVNSGVDLSDKEGRQVATRTMYRTRLNTDEELAEEQGHKPESAPLSPRRSLQDADAAKANNALHSLLNLKVYLVASDEKGKSHKHLLSLQTVRDADDGGGGSPRSSSTRGRRSAPSSTTRRTSRAATARATRRTPRPRAAPRREAAGRDVVSRPARRKLRPSGFAAIKSSVEKGGVLVKSTQQGTPLCTFVRTVDARRCGSETPPPGREDEGEDEGEEEWTRATTRAARRPASAGSDGSGGSTRSSMSGRSSASFVSDAPAMTPNTQAPGFKAALKKKKDHLKHRDGKHDNGRRNAEELRRKLDDYEGLPAPAPRRLAERRRRPRAAPGGPAFPSPPPGARRSALGKSVPHYMRPTIYAQGSGAKGVAARRARRRWRRAAANHRSQLGGVFAGKEDGGGSGDERATRARSPGDGGRAASPTRARAEPPWAPEAARGPRTPSPSGTCPARARRGKIAESVRRHNWFRPVLKKIGDATKTGPLPRCMLKFLGTAHRCIANGDEIDGDVFFQICALAFRGDDWKLPILSSVPIVCDALSISHDALLAWFKRNGVAAADAPARLAPRWRPRPPRDAQRAPRRRQRQQASASAGSARSTRTAPGSENGGGGIPRRTRTTAEFDDRPRASIKRGAALSARALGAAGPAEGTARRASNRLVLAADATRRGGAAPSSS
ncbi:hypothetical protein JL720_7642 [Aureococcus anophagefferens]|nr:hypothetical protein JL720_7642 [Aureococcus anophagefferens]